MRSPSTGCAAPSARSDFWQQGLFYGGGAGQLVSQLIGVAAVGAFVAVTAGILFLVIKAIIGLRVSPEEELAGLDVLEHGAPGYGPAISPRVPAVPVGAGRVSGATV